MNITRKYPMLGSSVDPEKISLTIKSLGLALVPVVLAVLRMSGYETFTENDIVVVVNSAATVVSVLGVTWGILRKFKK